MAKRALFVKAFLFDPNEAVGAEVGVVYFVVIGALLALGTFGLGHFR